VDGSFGLNGPTFTFLRAALFPFKDLRVPARFSMLVGLSLSILAGYGVARVLDRWPRQRIALTLVMLAVGCGEAISQPGFMPLWREPPSIYSHITDGPAVIAEFPIMRDRLDDSHDPQFMYFSTFHWNTLVNGYSGFLPDSYNAFLENEREFPSEKSLA